MHIICTHTSSFTYIRVLRKEESSLFQLLPGVSLFSFDFAMFFVVFDLVVVSGFVVLCLHVVCCILFVAYCLLHIVCCCFVAHCFSDRTFKKNTSKTI